MVAGGTPRVAGRRRGGGGVAEVVQAAQPQVGIVTEHATLAIRRHYQGVAVRG